MKMIYAMVALASAMTLTACGGGDDVPECSPELVSYRKLIADGVLKPVPPVEQRGDKVFDGFWLISYNFGLFPTPVYEGPYYDPSNPALAAECRMP